MRNSAEEAARAHHWYALRVPPQKEFIARDILTRKGLATFLPVESVWRKRNKYTKVKELRQYPLAPRYVFTGFPKEETSWFNVFQLPCIQGVVGINGEPKKLDEAGMSRLMSLYRNAVKAPKEQKWMVTKHEFKEGDIVQIMSGPFEGLTVPVVKIIGGHARVMLNLFNTEVPKEELLANLIIAA